MKSRITELLGINIQSSKVVWPGLLMVTWLEPFQMLVDSELLVAVMAPKEVVKANIDRGETNH